MAGIKIRETNIEKKGSPVRWERADPLTAEKIAAAIKSGPAARMMEILWFFAAAFLLFVMAGCVMEAGRVSFSEALVLCFLGVLLPGLILCLSLYRYIRERPFLHPGRQAEIWIFRTKCCGRSLSGGRYTSSPLGYYARFNSKGGPIQIRISRREYEADPTGKKVCLL